MEISTVQESIDSSRLGPAEELDMLYEQYLEDLVFLCAEHMSWYEMGFVQTKDFTPETVDDVYNNNLYCMNWFYNGAFPFDTYELQYENYLAQQVLDVMMYEESYY